MTYTLVFPVIIGAYAQINPLVRSLYLMVAAMFFLKFLSYHHVWHDVRHHVVLANKIEKEKNESKTNEKTEEISKDKNDVKTKGDNKKKRGGKIPVFKANVTMPHDRLSNSLNIPQSLLDSVLKYPSNVSLFDVIIFCLIPTLNFQLKYPFTNRYNVFGFLWRIMLYLFLMGLYVTIILEYCMPLVYKCSDHFKREEYVDFIYYFIKLSVPNTYSWLLMFYATFHLYLNAYAELTGFADKNFYDDWWNSTSLGEYWRKWNLPVHHWLIRHIYYPMIRRKYSRGASIFVVFFFSALMHEYLLAGCIERVTLIGFNSMAFQIPFILIQEKYKKYLGGIVGNISFWLAFCVIGQPGGMVFGYIFLN